MKTIAKRPILAMAAAFCLAAAMLISAALANPAYAETVTLPSPFGVTDDVTRVEVSKLAADDHTYVQGASMAIIEEDTGAVIASWTTGSGPELIEKVLDVNKRYILREISAPQGFDVVRDTIFVVNPSEAEGITILEGPDAELTESYKVALYEKRLPYERELIVRQTRVGAPTTGDDTPFGLVIGIGAAAIVGIIALQIAKPRKKKEN